jgi:N-acetylglucosamine-6-sulfatase
MKKTILVVASVALGALLLSIAYTIGGLGDEPRSGQENSSKPNFVFILADDMRYDELKYMPKTRSLLGDEGMTFNEAFVSDALCCPSRATILRGQYAHNTGVWTNRSGPDGGWEAYESRGHESDDVATRLDDAGYSTGLFGKYFNGYERTSVPPGWDEWFATTTYQYFDYPVDKGGTTKRYGTGDSDYSTDVLRRQTRQFIDSSAASGDPFFAYVAPVAPHGPATPAPRDEHTYDGDKAPRPPSFNEEDISDKPPWIRGRPRLSAKQIGQIDALHEDRVESLQALDDLVEGVVQKLKTAGVLDNTYIIFTSDNGWHFGEHRIDGDKWRPYEESIHMPLLVRGPGVAAGSTTDKLALNTDFFPTFTDLAGIQTPSYVDGRSLRPVLESSASTWRTAILLERRISSNSSHPSEYYGIRTEDGRTYVEYEGGFRELYDLSRDPYELSNEYAAATPPAKLAERVRALKACAGDACRAAENEP